LRAFQRARAATTLWLELRRVTHDRHGQSPRHAHAFLDTLVAPCVTIDGAITVLRGAQAAFLLDGTLLEIDPDAFAADHEAHVGVPATTATATVLRSYPEPHLAAAGAPPGPRTPSRCSSRRTPRGLPRRGTFATGSRGSLARAGLRFDATTGWNRYTTPPWATFHQLAAAALIAR
jgi:hypothetical protein